MPLTRRTMLMTPPLGALALGAPALAQTQTPAPTSASSGTRQAPGFYRYKVGDIKVTAINDGFAMRPLEGFVRNAELAQVQQALQDASLPTAALPISYTSLVLTQGDRVTLIEAGNGTFGAPTSGTWMANFRAAGFVPAKVRTAVFSHFHGDHINGFRAKDGSAVFPNAEVMVPAAEWAFWMDDARMSRRPTP
jgi:glyoxylase-like metal-dependent hydrolase (beta-lactamase superfamily II)